MAGRKSGPEAEYVKAPFSIRAENEAEIVEPPRQTIPHTPTNKAGQTIPVLKVANPSLPAIESQAGGAA